MDLKSNRLQVSAAKMAGKCLVASVAADFDSLLLRYVSL